MNDHQSFVDVNDGNHISDSLYQNCSKKYSVRDSLIVIPVLIFTAVWLILTLGLKIDLSFGSGYAGSVIFNLLLPLFMIGIGHIVYAFTLMAEVIHSDRTLSKKLLYCLVVWFSANLFFYFLYIFRMIFRRTRL